MLTAHAGWHDHPLLQWFSSLLACSPLTSGPHIFGGIPAILIGRTLGSGLHFIAGTDAQRVELLRSDEMVHRLTWRSGGVVDSIKEVCQIGKR